MHISTTVFYELTCNSPQKLNKERKKEITIPLILAALKSKTLRNKEAKRRFKKKSANKSCEKIVKTHINRKLFHFPDSI